MSRRVQSMEMFYAIRRALGRVGRERHAKLMQLQFRLGRLHIHESLRYVSP